MFQALVLVCALNVPVCDVNSADDIQHVKVPVMMCGLAEQAALAGQAGDRAAGLQVKVLCGKID